MPKVSIIMPSLNVAQYIRECMDSVVGQTLQDIEILCVDAGSTDGTLEILHEYAAQDKRIHIINSERKSYGYQMNLGFDIVKGEYLGIVETDDYIEPEMFKTLYDIAIQEAADFVKSDFYMFADVPNIGRLTLENKLFDYAEFNNGSKVVSYIDYIKQSVPIDTFMWNGIYKRDFVQKHNVRLNETPDAAYQDTGFRYQVALLVQRGIFIPSAFYHYRRDNANSSMNSPKGLQYDLQESQYIMKWVTDRFPKDNSRIRAVSREIAPICINSLKKSALNDNPDTHTFIEIFHELLRRNYNDGNLVKEDFSSDKWLELHMFLENLKSYKSYMRLKAESEFKLYYDFLSLMQSQKEIVIFGCGKVGISLNFLLSKNGILNVVCFCDNNQKKWGSQCIGKEILSPQEAVASHPHAFFLIANRANSMEIMHQLISLNLSPNNIGIYQLSSDPFVCTSKFLE